IGARLATGFAVIIALLIGIATLGINRIDAIDHNTEIILHDRYVKVALAHEIENQVNKQARALRTSLIASDAAGVSGELAKIEESSKAVAKAVETLQAIIRTERGKRDLANLIAARTAFVDLEQRLVTMIKEKRIAEGRDFLVKELLGPQGKYLASI